MTKQEQKQNEIMEKIEQEKKQAKLDLQKRMSELKKNNKYPWFAEQLEFLEQVDVLEEYLESKEAGDYLTKEQIEARKEKFNKNYNKGLKNIEGGFFRRGAKYDQNKRQREARSERLKAEKLERKNVKLEYKNKLKAQKTEREKAEQKKTASAQKQVEQSKVAQLKEGSK